MKRLIEKFMAWLGFVPSEAALPPKHPLASADELRVIKGELPYLSFWLDKDGSTSDRLDPCGEDQLLVASRMASFTAYVAKVKPDLTPEELGPVVARMWYGYKDEEDWDA